MDDSQNINNTSPSMPEGNMNSAPQMTNMTPPPQNKDEHSSAGPIVGSVIIIIVIVLGGLYFLSQRTSVTPEEGVSGDEIRQEQDNVSLDLGVQGSSDEISDIEEDLNDTELDNLDEDLDNIDSEFNF